MVPRPWVKPLDDHGYEMPLGEMWVNDTPLVLIKQNHASIRKGVMHMKRYILTEMISIGNIYMPTVLKALTELFTISKSPAS